MNEKEQPKIYIETFDGRKLDIKHELWASVNLCQAQGCNTVNGNTEYWVNRFYQIIEVAYKCGIEKALSEINKIVFKNTDEHYIMYVNEADKKWKELETLSSQTTPSSEEEKS